MAARMRQMIPRMINLSSSKVVWSKSLPGELGRKPRWRLRAQPAAVRGGGPFTSKPERVSRLLRRSSANAACYSERQQAFV